MGKLLYDKVKVAPVLLYIQTNRFKLMLCYYY